MDSRKQLSPAGRICYELAMWLSVSLSLSPHGQVVEHGDGKTDGGYGTANVGDNLET